MKLYDFVIFDLDGTLLYTLPDLTGSLNAALTACGYPPRTPEETRLFVGNGVRRLVARGLPGGTENPQYEAVYAAFAAHYAVHGCDRTVPYPGILPLLDGLNGRGVGTAVVSNKNDSDAGPMIRRFFADRIAVTIGKKPEYGVKPAPDAVWEAMARLGAAAERTVYVGDSEVDFATAQNAGLDCVLVSWGYRERDALAALGAAGLIDEPAELLTYVRGG